ncbi:unnamed protein product, partial [Menidia menidia]
VSESYKSTGVFLLTDGGKYTLNYTDATDACLLLNVTMATFAQVEKAHQHGLETCKYGWVADRIAVVPRLVSDRRCGQGNTGVVAWSAPLTKMFGVFCFNSSALADLDKSLETSSDSSNPLTTLTQAPTPASPLVRTSSVHTSSTRTQITSKPPQQTSETLAPLFGTTHTASISSSASPSLNPISTHAPVSPHHFTTSDSVDYTADFSTSAPPSTFSATPELALSK